MRGTNKLTVNDATLHEMLTSYLNEYVFTSNDQIVKVTDFAEIAAYGVMSTPGLVVDEKVLSAGKVLTAAEIGALL